MLMWMDRTLASNASIIRASVCEGVEDHVDLELKGESAHQALNHSSLIPFFHQDDHHFKWPIHTPVIASVLVIK